MEKNESGARHIHTNSYGVNKGSSGFARPRVRARAGPEELKELA